MKNKNLNSLYNLLLQYDFLNDMYKYINLIHFLILMNFLH